MAQERFGPSPEKHQSISVHINRVEPPPHSYDAFASQPPIYAVDAELAARAHPARLVLDVGTGTGAMLQHLSEQRKFLPGYCAVGLDPDAAALRTAQEKFAHPDNNIQFVLGVAERLPFIRNTFDLVVQANNLHLTRVKESFEENYRVLKRGGLFIASTAYEKNSAYDPETEKFWGNWTALARRELPNIEINGKRFNGKPGSPIDLRQHTTDQLVTTAYEAGFRKVETKLVHVGVDARTIKDIGDYYGYAEGAFPGVPPEFGSEALKKTVEPAFERTNRGREQPLTTIGRNWTFVEAYK